MSYHAPKIQNETQHDGREVNGIVRYVFRHLDLDGRRSMVKVKHHTNGHAYQGRFYANAHDHQAFIYDWERAEWNEVGPKVPYNIDHLLVCRIAKPGRYPVENHVYDRKDSPGTWIIENWQRALVAVAAHEAMHLRQYLTKAKGRGRYSEVETEWAAKRIHDDWVADQQKKGRNV